MTQDRDIVADIIARIDTALREYLANDLGFEQSIIDTVSQQIYRQDAPVRRHWARTEAYVPARSPEKARAKQLALDEVARTGNVAEASTRYGISRSHIYRCLKR